MSTRKLDLLDHIDRFLDELGQVKKAAMEDPGTKEGPSSHPSARMPWDSKVQDIPDTDSYGERAREHEQDIRESTHGSSAVNFAEKPKSDGTSSKDHPGESPRQTTSDDNPELDPERTSGDDLPSSYKEGIEGKKIAFAKLAEQLTQIGDQLISFLSKDVEECAECPGFDEAVENGKKVAEAVAEIDDKEIAEVVRDTVMEAKVAADLTVDFLAYQAEAIQQELLQEKLMKQAILGLGGEVGGLESLVDQVNEGGEEEESTPPPPPKKKEESSEEKSEEEDEDEDEEESDEVKEAALKLAAFLLFKEAMEDLAAPEVDPAAAAGEVEPEEEEEEDHDVDEEEVARALAALLGEGGGAEEEEAEPLPEEAALEDVAKSAAAIINLQKALREAEKEKVKRARAFNLEKNNLMNQYIQELIRINRL